MPRQTCCHCFGIDGETFIIEFALILISLVSFRNIIFPCRSITTFTFQNTGFSEWGYRYTQYCFVSKSVHRLFAFTNSSLWIINTILTFLNIIFQVYLSHRDSPIPFLSKVHQVARVSSVKSDSVVLDDGSEIAVDTILFCTGYTYSFPFLSSECAVQVDRRRVTPLYKHLFHTKYPTLCFVGICEFTPPNLHFHNQILFFLATLDGRVVLPSQEDMDADTRADYERRLEMGMHHQQSHFMFPKLFREYEEDITALAHLPPLPPVLFDIFADTFNRFSADFPNYREVNIAIIDDQTFEHRKV